MTTNDNDSDNSVRTGSRCQDSEYLQERVIKAAEQMVTAALSFLRNAVMSKSDDAATSFAEMRIALIRCSAANNVWTQHRAEDGCS
jgi:hypothetical protein